MTRYKRIGKATFTAPTVPTWGVWIYDKNHHVQPIVLWRETTVQDQHSYDDDDNEPQDQVDGCYIQEDSINCDPDLYGNFVGYTHDPEEAPAMVTEHLEMWARIKARHAQKAAEEAAKAPQTPVEPQRAR